MKRARVENDEGERPRKMIRIPVIDRLSRLSDELLVRILSFSSVPTLLTCQRVSKKLGRISTDSQLWKAAYYNTFVRPRASRISGIRNPANAEASEHLHFSSKLSKWLDDSHLVRKGPHTNWKQQYRLRHNWQQGQCAVSEIVVAERPPEPPLLVMLHNGMVFTADSISGLRAWNSKDRRELIASIPLASEEEDAAQLPTSMAIDACDTNASNQRIAIGFEDGSFSIYALRRSSESDGGISTLFRHPRSSNGMLSALAYSHPYLLTMTEDHIVSLYSFTSALQSVTTLDALKLIYSLRSHTAWPPVSLSVRVNPTSMTAAIAYALPTYLSGWTVGIQEMRLSHTGSLIESRLAVADSTSSSSTLSSLLPTASRLGASPSSSRTPPRLQPSSSQPTSLSYSHPYLLAAHPDNTLTVYLVKSTLDTLSISPGTRLWGHTSSVSGAHVGMRGKAVSVSRLGDELRVWDLEGGVSGAARKRGANGELSVRVQPARTMSVFTNDEDAEDEIVHGDGKIGLRKINVSPRTAVEGLKYALAQGLQDGPVSQTLGWVGFDEQSVIVLREKDEGRQALVVYDFA